MQFPEPDSDTRRHLWQRYLDTLGVALWVDDLRELGERFGSAASCAR